MWVCVCVSDLVYKAATPLIPTWFSFHVLLLLQPSPSERYRTRCASWRSDSPPHVRLNRFWPFTFPTRGSLNAIRGRLSSPLIHSDRTTSGNFFFFFLGGHVRHTHTNIYSQHLFNNLDLCIFTEAQDGTISLRNNILPVINFNISLTYQFIPTHLCNPGNYQGHKSIAVGPN